MKHNGIIKRVIEAVGLDDGTLKGNFTPSQAKSLVKNENGEPASGMFSYSSVVDMLLYLSGNTNPDVAFAANSCARYMFSPKNSYELELKILECYLNQTKDIGMVLNLNPNVCKVDAYPNSGFDGMYGHEEPTDPAYVKRPTGFIIKFSDCPLLWVSKLHTKTALSNMEA